MTTGEPPASAHDHAATARVPSSGTILRAPIEGWPSGPSNAFLVWREFVWGGLAGAFGEGMMHPVDTIKTRLQSQAVMTGSQGQKSIFQMIRMVWAADGPKGFYRGVAPGVTGSLATGATYFGIIESTKKRLEERHPGLAGHWAHFIAGAVGDTLGSFVYVPCEVIKQRMQVQGTRTSWNAALLQVDVSHKTGEEIYCYYKGMFYAGRSIWKQSGLKGLYAGYWSTLARDVPFAGLMVTFYEALKGLELTNVRGLSNDLEVSNSCEGLFLGGLAGGLAAYVTTPLDVIKTRLQVQGSTLRYNGWLDAIRKTWKNEGFRGMFKGSVPRILWYIPASSLTFMAVEFLRDHFNEKPGAHIEEVASITIDSVSQIQEPASSQ